MSHNNNTILSWHRAVGGPLRLRIGDHSVAGLCRTVDVPTEVAPLLTDEPSGSHRSDDSDRAIAQGALGVHEGGRRGGHGSTVTQTSEPTELGSGVTSDPAGDLIRLEGRLHHHVTLLHHTTRHLQQTVNSLRAELTTLTVNRTRATAGKGMSAVRERRRIATQLRDAIEELAVAVDAHDHASDQLRAVREFVLSLDVPDGPLAHTRASWHHHGGHDIGHDIGHDGDDVGDRAGWRGSRQDRRQGGG